MKPDDLKLCEHVLATWTRGEEVNYAHETEVKLARALKEVYAVLDELCELESMKERANMMGEFGLQMYFDYKRRNPGAWKRAFELFEKYRMDKPPVPVDAQGNVRPWGE